VIGRALVGAGAAGLLALSLAVTPGTAAPPTGTPAGLALLARVHRAYVVVPGVTISLRTGPLVVHFTVALRSGIQTAEQVVLDAPNGMTTFVARRNASTFTRGPGSSCWRRVAVSNPQTIDSIGLPFPDQPHMHVGSPRQTSTGWLLPVAGDGGPATFAIDGASLLIRSVTSARVVEQARTLRSRPMLASPKPLC
jgi:hypothetical protein